MEKRTRQEYECLEPNDTSRKKDNLKRRILSVWLIFMLFFLSGCCLNHNWVEATCTEPKTCSKCGETEGEALGHAWVNASCETPKTCSVCGATKGDALGHTWVEATCTRAAYCSVCGKNMGKSLGHDWKSATCETPKTCIRCGLTEGKALEHTGTEIVSVGAPYEKDKGYYCDITKLCSRCGKEYTVSIASTKRLMTPGTYVSDLQTSLTTADAKIDVITDVAEDDSFDFVYGVFYPESDHSLPIGSILFLDKDGDYIKDKNSLELKSVLIAFNESDNWSVPLIQDLALAHSIYVFDPSLRGNMNYFDLSKKLKNNASKVDWYRTARNGVQYQSAIDSDGRRLFKIQFSDS